MFWQNTRDWKLVPDSYDLIKMTIQQDLVIFNGSHTSVGHRANNSSSK